MKPEAIPSATLDGLRRAILDHYDRTARDLPWRTDTDPYRVLVSEIMLQQTRVETVTRYYEPWLERFPTVEALASAHEDEVLKAWEGLGYYRRARNLHAAARMVAERHGGEIPAEPDELRSLPGVGEYTSGAVASIAFDRPAPAVDGNVRRVLARLFDDEHARPAWLRRVATRLLSEERPGDWTQALMELGATVCTPRSPACDVCPVASRCQARRAGTVSERPAPPLRRAVPSRQIGLVVFHSEGRALLQKRPDDGLLGGMWAFPELLRDDGSYPAVERLAGEFGLRTVGEPRPLEAVEHRFTHLAARYVPVAVEVAPVVPDVAEQRDDVRWMGPKGRTDTALPVAQRRVFDFWIENIGVTDP